MVIDDDGLESKDDDAISLTGDGDDGELVKSSSSTKSEEWPGYLQHLIKFKSSYMHHTVDGVPEVTTCHDRGAITVDFIFYTPSVRTDPSSKVGEEGEIVEHEELWLSGVLSLLSQKQLKDMNTLPNKYLSSDHLLLMASFILR